VALNEYLPWPLFAHDHGQVRDPGKSTTLVLKDIKPSFKIMMALFISAIRYDSSVD
jgi:hypothetical protein